MPEIDPALAPFLDALAALLVAEQARNAVARHELRDALDSQKSK